MQDESRASDMTGVPYAVIETKKVEQEHAGRSTTTYTTINQFSIFFPFLKTGWIPGLWDTSRANGYTEVDEKEDLGLLGKPVKAKTDPRVMPPKLEKSRQAFFEAIHADKKERGVTVLLNPRTYGEMEHNLWDLFDFEDPKDLGCCDREVCCQCTLFNKKLPSTTTLHVKEFGIEGSDVSEAEKKETEGFVLMQGLSGKVEKHFEESAKFCLQLKWSVTFWVAIMTLFFSLFFGITFFMAAGDSKAIARGQIDSSIIASIVSLCIAFIGFGLLLLAFYLSAAHAKLQNTRLAQMKPFLRFLEKAPRSFDSMPKQGRDFLGEAEE